MQIRFILGFTLLGCVPALDDPCTKDQDCPAAESCQQGWCLPSPESDISMADSSITDMLPMDSGLTSDSMGLPDAFGPPDSTIAPPDWAVNPLPPPILQTIPAEVGSDTSITVTGLASGTQIYLFQSGDCDGPPSDSAEIFDDQFNLTLNSIPMDTVLTLSAFTEDDLGNISSCALPVTYESNIPPQFIAPDIVCQADLGVDVELEAVDTPADQNELLFLYQSRQGACEGEVIIDPFGVLHTTCPGAGDECQITLSVSDGTEATTSTFTIGGEDLVSPANESISAFLESMVLTSNPLVFDMHVDDFDRDGSLDIAIATAQEIVVFFQGPARIFRQVSTPIPNGHHRITSGKDRDANVPYLAVTHRDQGIIEFYRVTPENFSLQHTINALGGPNEQAPSPTDLLLRDLDNNGFTDLVTIDESNRHLVVTFANQAGRENRMEIYPLAGNRPTGISFGDLNNDGQTDIAISVQGTPMDVGVLLNLPNRNHRFRQPVYQNIGPGNAHAVWMSQQSGDLLIAMHRPSLLFQLKLDPRNLQRVLETDQVGLFGNPSQISVLNVYGDDSIDAIIPAGRAGLTIVPGHPDHPFAEPVHLGFGAPVIDGGAVDLDADGRVDLGALTLDGKVHIRFGDASPRGQTAPAIRQGMVGQIHQLLTSDVDADGRPDLVTLGATRPWLRTFLSIDVGAGTEERAVAVEHPPERIWSIDFNHDGLLNLVTLHDQSLTVLRNMEDAEPILIEDLAGPTQLTVLTDIDGSNSLPEFFQATVQQLNWWRLDGAIASPQAPSGDHTNLSAIATGDINGDGIPEVLVADQEPMPRIIIRSLSEPNVLGPARVFISPIQVVQMHIQDINGDGLGDVTASGEHDLRVFWSVGDTLEPGPVFPIATNDFTTHDFDGDGRVDLVIGNENGLHWTRQIAIGEFGPLIEIPFAESVDEVVVADFNQDGRPDLAVANSVGIYLIHQADE